MPLSYPLVSVYRPLIFRIFRLLAVNSLEFEFLGNDAQASGKNIVETMWDQAPALVPGEVAHRAAERRRSNQISFN